MTRLGSFYVWSLQTWSGLQKGNRAAFFAISEGRASNHKSEAA